MSTIVKFNNKKLQFNNKIVSWSTTEPPSTAILPFNIAESYAYFNLNDLEYNKNYKINTENIPSEAAAFYIEIYNESWSTVTSFSVPNYTNYIFNLSDVISETQYNNPYIECWFMNRSWSPINPMPSDISIVEA